MSNIEEIVSPTYEVVKADNCFLSIRTDKETCEKNGWDWYCKSGGDVFPFEFPKDNFLFRLPTKEFDWPEEIEITIAKKKDCHTRVIRTTNQFGSLPTIFSNATMYAIITGIVDKYPFNPENKVMEVKGTDDEVEFEVPSDDPLEKNEGYEDPWGDMFVSVFWKFSVTDKMIKVFMDRLNLCPSERFQNLEGAVNLVANTGKVLKFPKGLLAVSSPKFVAQFEKDAEDKVTFSLGNDEIISEDGLQALLEFIWSFSLKKPMETASIALELLMAAHYHMISELELLMQNILLLKSSEWFDTPTSCRLFLYASQISSVVDTDKEKEVWDNLMWKALRNMSLATTQELEECQELEFWFSHQIPCKWIKALISVA